MSPILEVLDGPEVTPLPNLAFLASFPGPHPASSTVKQESSLMPRPHPLMRRRARAGHETSGKGPGTFPHVTDVMDRAKGPGNEARAFQHSSPR